MKHIPKEDLKEEDACCGSCLGEKEMGYGDDVDGCCCKHVQEICFEIITPPPQS